MLSSVSYSPIQGTTMYNINIIYMLHLTTKMNWKSKKNTYDYLVRKFIADSRLLLVLWSVRIIHMSYLAAIIIIIFFLLNFISHYKTLITLLCGSNIYISSRSFNSSFVKLNLRSVNRAALVARANDAKRSACLGFLYCFFSSSYKDSSEIVCLPTCLPHFHKGKKKSKEPVSRYEWSVSEHQGNQITEKVEIIIFFLLPQLRFETGNKRSYSCQKRVVHGRWSGQPREKIEWLRVEHQNVLIREIKNVSRHDRRIKITGRKKKTLNSVMLRNPLVGLILCYLSFNGLGNGGS